MISYAPLLHPNLSLGLILNNPFNKDFAYVDKPSGRGTGFEMIFFNISFLFLE